MPRLVVKTEPTPEAQPKAAAAAVGEPHVQPKAAAAAVEPPVQPKAAATAVAEQGAEHVGLTESDEMYDIDDPRWISLPEPLSVSMNF